MVVRMGEVGVRDWMTRAKLPSRAAALNCAALGVRVRRCFTLRLLITTRLSRSGSSCGWHVQTLSSPALNLSRHEAEGGYRGCPSNACCYTELSVGARVVGARQDLYLRTRRGLRVETAVRVECTG